jgi:hypothetical protein
MLRRRHLDEPLGEMYSEEDIQRWIERSGIALQLTRETRRQGVATAII